MTDEEFYRVLLEIAESLSVAAEKIAAAADRMARPRHAEATK
jgi:hypothetical protein